MILSMSGQAMLFLWAVVVGAGIGLLYDVFRIFRKTARHSTLAVQLEDLFFWLAATAGTFYFMLTRSFGEIRLFAVLGAFLGCVIYLATVSRFVVKAFVAVINYLKKVFKAAFKIILLPLRLVAAWLSPPITAFLRKRRKDLRGLSRYGRIGARKALRNLFILRKKV